MAKAQSIKNDVDALFIERERAQVTLDSIGDAVASTDFRGHVRYLNKAAEQLTGVSQEDAFGRPIAMAVVSDKSGPS